MSTDAKGADASADASAAPAKKGLMQNTKLLIALAVVAIMAIEGAVMLVVFSPSGNSAGSKEGDGMGEIERVIDSGTAHTEINLDSFNCSNNLAAPGSTLHISIRLAVTVPSSEQTSFKSAYEVHKSRVQEAVNIILRRSSLEDLNEPELGTIKRRLTESINKVLNKSFVKDVIITEVRIMEQ